ncbi:MAG: PEP-CTERM sorting domain-containing protein [Paludibaculum sp.]
MVANVPSAEMLHFVPTTFSGNPVEGFYGANYTPNVIKADHSQFSGLLGDIIVTGEITHAVTALHWNGAGFDSSNVGSFPNQPEDGIFVTERIVNPGNPTPEPTTYGLMGLGLVALCLVSTVRRNRPGTSPN